MDNNDEENKDIKSESEIEELADMVASDDSLSEEERKEARKKAREMMLVDAGIGKHVIQKSVETVMHESMLPYSEHVILDRALPRVEDGLKPVQRRILYTMLELGITPDKPYRKSARIVGDCLGKYHPHGDTSVYDAMVRLAQPFNMSECLVDGHGNFGSVDGDGAAAMRYTEARMAPLALEMLRDLEKDTVEWDFNFDDSLKEPTTLPSRFPNILVNGASGIAVGLATNIPPHNLSEVISGVCAYIDKPTMTLDEMMKYIKAPDFPTGGLIIDSDEIKKAYETGKGKILIRAKVHIEKGEYDKKNIVITELPYQVNKARLLTKILELRDEKKDKLAGIAEICDESDRKGMRAVIKVKKDFDPVPIVEYLYKSTDLQTTFGINMVAIADGRPQQMGLLDIIAYYVDYQRNIIYRRTKFDLDAAKERAHILEGLVIACKNIDEVVKIIKTSENTSIAKTRLRDRFQLSDRQAQAILDMRLARLTSLEVLKLTEELEELKKLIIRLTAIVNSKKLQLDIVKEEMQEIKKKYKQERRTNLASESETFSETSEKDVRTQENIVISISRAKTIKSMTQKHCASANTEFSEKTTDNDIYTVLRGTMSDKTLLAFTNFGNAFKIDAMSVPDGKWRDKGVLFSTFESKASVGEVPVAIVEMPEDQSGELLFYSKNGMIKKTDFSEYNLQKNGFQATKFKDDDELIKVEVNRENTTILFVTEGGMVLNAVKDDIPLQGRVSGGVKGISLASGDAISFVGQVRKDDSIVIVTDRSFAKKVKVSEIEESQRYRKGVMIMPLKGDVGKKIIFSGIVKKDKQIYDIIFKSLDGVSSAYSTEAFMTDTRTGKGKSMVKNKKGEEIVEAFKYNNQIEF